MSHSPLDDGAPAEPGAGAPSPAGADGPDERSAYAAGWSALSKSLRRGFSWSGNERNCAFLNLGGREPAFADVSAVSGLDLTHDGRAAIAVDWDRDGDLDVWLASRSGPRLTLLRNDLGDGHALALRPVGTTSNRDGVGARIEVRLAGEPPLVLARTRRAGEGLLAQAGDWVHFGTAGRAVEGVTVEWPGGEREVFSGVKVGETTPARYVLVQGAGAARREDAEEALARPALAPDPRNGSGSASGASRVVLRSPRPVPALLLETRDGRSARFLGVEPGGSSGTRRPLLLVLWAQWCAPCIAELAELSERADELRTAGIDVLALSVDEPAQRGAAAARLAEVEWPFSGGFAGPAAVAVLDVLAGSILDSEERLALPTSFLLDGEGRAVALYRGPADVAQVLVDARLPGLDADQRLAAATPFPGRWAELPPEFDAGDLARRYARRGLPGPARELELSQVEVRELERAEFQLARGRAHLSRGDLPSAVAAFQAAVAEDPRSAEAHRELGLALHRQGQLAEACAAYRAALQLEPDDDRTRFNLALGAAALDRMEEAEAQLQELRDRESALAPELDARLETVRGD